jgi:protease-4
MKNFFLNILSSMIAMMLLGFFALFFLFAMIGALTADTEVVVSKPSYLTISLSGTIPQYTVKSDLDDMFNTPREMSVHDITFSLDEAAYDPNITGVLLHINHLSVSFATVEDIKVAIEAFKKRSDKPVVAFVERASNKEYFLATAADSIFMQPEGNIILTSLQISMDFYKETLAHFGVEASFIPVGKYKSAPDTYTKTEFSAENRTQYTHLLNIYQSLLTNNIISTRSVGIDDVEKIYGQGWFSAPTALAQGLVDRVLYWDEIQDKLAESGNKFSSVNLKSYRETLDLGSDRSKQIAIIYAEGAIMEGNDGENLMMGSVMGSNRLVRNIRSAAANSRIKGIILRIDSPGGSSMASDIVWREIQRAREKKPVFTSIGGAAASGGYYLAMGTDRIFAQESSIVGSIGVYLGKYNIHGFESDWLKMRSDKIILDEKNDLNFFNASRSFTSQERAILSRDLRQFYNRFVSKAADGRKMTPEKMATLAEGRVWTARDGIENGLVDDIGGLRACIEALSSQLDLRERPKLNIYPKPSPLFDEVKSKSLIESKALSPQRILDELKVLNRVQSWALWPAKLDIN